MNELQKNYIAALRADAQMCRDMAQRLRFLSEYIIGQQDLMLKQADTQEASAKEYTRIAERAEKEWSK